MTTQEKRQFHTNYGTIMKLSAWGFVIVVASFVFLSLGYQLDQWLNTPPTFMVGLFFLALVTSIGRLYQEAWRKKKDV
ncbi:MAG: AtpZ/AtpI family protein [Deltaproteobacteria bacterium]|nr:AtpZ/AtpI family protein [Deltaproteobacteria bacterium]